MPLAPLELRFFFLSPVGPFFYFIFVPQDDPFLLPFFSSRRSFFVSFFCPFFRVGPGFESRSGETFAERRGGHELPGRQGSDHSARGLPVGVASLD